jgi:hypothetical protein
LLPIMRRLFLAALLVVIVGCGAVTAHDMRAIEPRATYKANHDVMEFRDCVYRWTRGWPTKYLTREYTKDGIYLKAGANGPMWMIAQSNGEINVHVHWNLIEGKDMPVYIAGRCNDDVGSEPPNGSWRNIKRESDWQRYVP